MTRAQDDFDDLMALYGLDGGTPPAEGGAGDKAAEARRVRAVDRLRALPAVFDLRDVEERYGFTNAVVRQYCLRWRQQGLIAPVGPRTGAFYNLLRDPDGPERRKPEAIARLLERRRPELVERVFGVPSVVVGLTALNWHGWTTQVSPRYELAVPRTDTLRGLPDVSGTLLVPRNKWWFRRAAGHIERVDGGFAVLAPEWALADALARGGRGEVWRPDPDDIAPPHDADRAELARRLSAAMEAMGVEEGTARDYLAALGLDRDAAPEAAPRA